MKNLYIIGFALVFLYFFSHHLNHKQHIFAKVDDYAVYALPGIGLDLVYVGYDSTIGILKTFRYIFVLRNLFGCTEAYVLAYTYGKESEKENEQNERQNEGECGGGGRSCG